MNNYNYIRHSIEYWHAARIVHENSGQSLVLLYSSIYYMLSLSCELALKHYLEQKGYTEKSLKKLGHNLSKLVSAAKQAGLPLYFVDEEAILLMDKIHKEHLFRYGFRGSVAIPPFLQLLNAGSRLIDFVSANPGLLRAGYGENAGYFFWPVVEINHVRAG